MFASLASSDPDKELHMLKDQRMKTTTGSMVSCLYHLKAMCWWWYECWCWWGGRNWVGGGRWWEGWRCVKRLLVRHPRMQQILILNLKMDAGFFVFPDLSARTEGSYQLKIDVIWSWRTFCSAMYVCRFIWNIFYVFTAKKFPGIEESTPLSCADQGIKIKWIIHIAHSDQVSFLRFSSPKATTLCITLDSVTFSTSILSNKQLYLDQFDGPV
jgi:hypothetical protein